MGKSYCERRASFLVETTSSDVRYALRSLRKNAAFTITSVAVLALAIGVNTAMFSVLNAVLFRPLPYPSPEQLAMLWSEVPTQGVREGRSAYVSVEEWRRRTRSFAGLAVFDPGSVTMMTASGAEQVSVARVSPNLFPLLGIQPSLGRIFSDREAEGREPLALITHRFWQTRFGGSPGVIGASLELDGHTSQIIGVLPAGFQLADLAADVWEPHTMFADWESRRGVNGPESWFALGRLRQNVSIRQAQQEMSAIARHLNELSPASGRNRGISVVPLSLQLTGPRLRLELWVLAGAVFCVLLISATNVASLSLARSAARAREFAIRAALGAGHRRLVRQVLAESITLAVISGLLGLAVAFAGVRLILAFRPPDLRHLNDLGLDRQALLFAFGLCLLTGLLVGLTPAITVARHNSTLLAAAGGRGVAGGLPTRRIRRGLVVTELALAVILMVGAGLLARSLWSVQRVDLGFSPERVVSMQISATAFSGATQLANFYERVLEEIASLPGVESAGIIGDLFIGGSPEQLVTTDGKTASERIRFRRDEVSSGFFKAIGTPLLRGRFFSAGDGPGSPKVAILNDAMARRLWPGSDAVGKRLKIGLQASDAPWFTVVGVVGNMRRQGLEIEPVPQIFEPLPQNPSRLATVLVRTSVADPLKMVGALQAAVHRVERHVPLYGIATLESRLGAFVAPRRFQTSLMTGFSVIALLLAAVGIYGLIQYSVATRTDEIGIRIALGAQAGDILRLIMGEGLKLTLTGLVVGLLGALWLARAGSALLFGVTADDPLTFITVIVTLTAIAAAACYFPAHHSTAVDPAVSLRQS